MNTTHSLDISLSKNDEFVECAWTGIDCNMKEEDRAHMRCLLCVLAKINQNLEWIAENTDRRQVEWPQAIGYAQQHGCWPSLTPKRRDHA